MTCRTPLIRALTALAGALIIVITTATTPAGNGRKFYDDDPLDREPETQDASGAQEQEIDLFYDLAENLFGHPGDSTPNVRARNITSVDEVPDSSWFTNRILARPLSVDQAVRGPLTGTGPATGTWSVVRPKQAGFAPGFTMNDAKGRDLVRLIRRRRDIPKRQRARFWSPTRSSGRWAIGRWRTT